MQKPTIDTTNLPANLQRVQNLTGQLHDQVESTAALYEQSRMDIMKGIASIKDPVHAAYAKQSVFSVT